MITYQHFTANLEVDVFLESKYAGTIRKTESGKYAYFPRGSKKGGHEYETINQVKRSIEGDDE